MLDVSSDQGTFRRSIRLVIADPQPIVLQGLKSVFAAQRDFEIVASCSTGTSCLEALRNLAPDVALVAGTLLDLTASEMLAMVQAERLPTRLVFFTESETEDLAAALAAGRCSAISKYAPPDTMLRTLRLMTEDIGASSEQSEDRSLNGKAIDAAKIDKMLGLLTQRESQIVRLVSAGLSNKEIARQLNVSQGTVKVHLHNIFQKLEISNRTVLATIALLQRPAGFGTLTLAAFAFAILDDVKASETNAFVDDDGTVYRESEHPSFEVWKKAILRHTVVVDSGDTAALTTRGSAIKASQATNPVARMEGLHAAEHPALSTTARGFGPIGSSTPGLFVSPLLQAINNSQTGSSAAQQPLPPPAFAASPMRSHGGYGASTAAAAGALVYAVENAHAAVQAGEPGGLLIDTAKVAAMDGASHVATITIHGPSNVANQDNAFKPLGHESVTAEGSTDRTSHAGGGGDTLDAADGNTANGEDGKNALVGGHGGDKLTGGNGGDILVHGAAKQSRSTQSDSFVDSASGADKINLAALGALAFLHLTSTSTTVPPHTLAWIYNPISNETIVYVNPTDGSLDIGDPALLEIHLQGAVNVAESDFVYAPEAAAVAAALEGIDPALLEAAAGDGILLAEETAYAAIEAEASESAPASVWTMPADDGFRFHFARDRINSAVSTSGLASAAEKPAYATEESGGGAVAVPAHISSIELAHSPATVLAEENPAFKNEAPHANAGVATAAHGPAHTTAGPQPFEFPTQSAAIVSPPPVAEPAAPGNSGGHSNAQHGSNSAAANTTEAPEPVEASAAPGNSGGHGNPQHAANIPPANSTEAPQPTATSAPGNSGEHSNAQHAPKLAAANTTEAPEPAATSVPGNSGGHSNSEHAANTPPANTTEAPDPVETSTAPGNSGGHSNAQHPATSVAANTTEAPEPAVTNAPGNSGGHSNSHAANTPPANTTEAPDPVETSTAPGNSGGHSNSQHPAKSAAANTTEAPEPTAISAPGNSGGHRSSQLAANAAPANTTEAAEPVETNAAPGNSGGHGNSQHGVMLASAHATEAPEPVETSAAPGNSGGHSNAQQASKSVATSTTEAPEPIEPGAAAGSGNGHSPHASPSATANAPAAAELPEPNVTPGHGNPEPASQPAVATNVAAAEPVEPGAAAGGGNGHSPHAAPSATANAPAAAELPEPNVTPGHGNAEPASQPAAAINVAAAEPIEPGAAAGGGNGHSPHAAPSATANAPVAAELPEPNATPGHGNPEPASQPAAAINVAAAEPIEPGAAAGGGNGNSPHAAPSAAASATPAEPASATGGASQAFHFNHQAMSSTPTETIAPEELSASPAPGPAAELTAILEAGPPAVEVHAASHVNNSHSPHHVTGHSSHELLT